METLQQVKAADVIVPLDLRKSFGPTSPLFPCEGAATGAILETASKPAPDTESAELNFSASSAVRNKSPSYFMNFPSCSLQHQGKSKD